MNRRAPLFVGIAFLLVAILAFFFLVNPKMGEVSDTQDALEEAQNEQTTLEAELARLQQAERDAPATQRQLARIRQKIPPVADLPGLINLLQDAADTSGVDFFSVTPGDPQPDPSGRAAVIPAGIQVIGGFFPVDEFLFRLETLRRAAKVVTISTTEGPDGAPQLSVTLAAEFYTTDTTAGPGAPPPSPSPAPSPGATPSPGASPSPTVTPTPTVSPGV